MTTKRITIGREIGNTNFAEATEAQSEDEDNDPDDSEIAEKATSERDIAKN